MRTPPATFTRGLWLFLLVLAMPWMGCSPTRITGVQVQALRLAIRFPGAAGSRAGHVSADRAGVTAQVDTVRVSVFASVLGVPEQLLARQAAGVSPGERELAISLSVTPAARYRIQVEANGRRQRAGRATETTYGLQYLGIAAVDDAALDAGPVQVQMQDAVPLLVGVRTARGDSLAWGAVPGASSYTVRDTLSVLATGLGGTSYQTGSYGTGYRVQATLTGGLVSAFSETFSVSAPAPTISALVPDTAVAGAPGLALAVTGTNFLSGAAVRWNGSNLATSYVSSTSLTAAVPAAQLASPGAVSVRVLNPDGLLSDAMPFTVIAPLPRVDAAVPDTGFVGDTVTVTGANFVNVSDVRINLTAAAYVVSSPTRLKLVVPSGASSGPVSVTTPGGTATSTAGFTVIAPVVQGISPNTVVVGAAGLTLSVSGRNFRNGATVTWNGGNLATTFVSASSLTAVVGAALVASTGSATVRVNDIKGQSSNSATFNVAAFTVPSYSYQWGAQGTGNGQFEYPIDIAADALGNIYVSDVNNNRVQKFISSTGVFAGMLGTSGTGNGQFSAPHGLAVDGSNRVYVSDTGNGRIQVFSAAGAYSNQWISYGYTPPYANGDPWGMTVDAANQVYITEANGELVAEYTQAGSDIRHWGTYGAASGQFNAPSGIVVDKTGLIYVTDSSNGRIQVFNGTGGYVSSWGATGSGDGQFNFPYGIAIDGQGRFYVSDVGNDRIQVFGATGAYLAQWGVTGAGNGQFQYPHGIAIDGAGRVFVADQYNHRIQVFGP